MSSELDKLRTIGQLIGDSGYAASFQTMGQYRQALLATVLALMGHSSIAIERPDGDLELTGKVGSGANG